jgi:ribosomal protein S18 acetylase RimI-like enzyme
VIDIRPADASDAGWLHDLQEDHWGGQFQVANGERYRPADLPGLVAEVDSERVGYAALRVVDGVAWIGLIQSLREREGIGSALVRGLIDGARGSGCGSLRAITTNDNRRAQRFYEGLGFRVREVRPGRVTESRKLKPSISLTGEDDIAITDEIEYEIAFEERSDDASR